MHDPNLTIWNQTFTVDSLSNSLFLQWWKILIFYFDCDVQTHTDSKNIPVPFPEIDISLIVFNKIRNISNLLLWVISLTDQASINLLLTPKENIIFKIYLKYHVQKTCEPHKIWWIIFVNIRIITYCRAAIKQDLSKRRLIEVFV